MPFSTKTNSWSMHGSFVQQHNLTFQQDNARPHVTRVCRDFLAQNNMIPLDWPSYSPDLSPIEHLWDKLGRQVWSRRRVPNNVQELTATIQQEWNQMPLRKINSLVNSMANRIHEATPANGRHIWYWLWTVFLISTHHTREQFNRYCALASHYVILKFWEFL